MPKSYTRSAAPGKSRERNSSRQGSARLRKISKSSAQIVKDAAALLDEELAAGIVAAKQVQRRFRKDRHIDPNDFKKSLEKFQGDAHEVVGLLDEQLSGLRLKENSNFARRLLRNTHDVVDLAVELVNMGAEIADQLVHSNLKAGAAPRAKRGS
jgi:hypothetical protein